VVGDARSRDDLVRSHHLIVFVLDDMAVPDVAELVAVLGGRPIGQIVCKWIERKSPGGTGERSKIYVEPPCYLR
jgi:hypothetical protein